jgi:hypothetical protein
MDETGQENTKRFNGRLLNSSKVATYETVFLVVLTIN